MVRNYLQEKLIQGIQRDGPIRLDHFIEHVLYTPKYGYYQQNAPSMQGQDFITAPELGMEFVNALDDWLRPTLQREQINKIIEIGPGSGALAKALGHIWKDELQDYFLLEKSTGLQNAQKKLCQSTTYQWIDQIKSFDSPVLILGNEYLDALAARRFKMNNQQCQEALIGYDHDFYWHYQNQSYSLDGYVPSESAMDIIDLKPVFQLLDPIKCGLVVFIDYGYHFSEYQALPYKQDSLRGFYRNQVIKLPWEHIGQMDLTVDVNFSRLAHEAHQANWDVVTYFKQSKLMMHSIEKRGIESMDPSHLRKLIYPDEMGERVRIMVLSRNCHLNDLVSLGLECL